MIQVVGYDPTTIRGLVVWAVPSNDPMFRRCNGEPLIKVARELTPAWQRLVIVKEVMHYFDTDLEKVTTAQEFEELVSEFSSEKPEDSPAMASEIRALWRALAALCPESLRQQYQRRRTAGEIDDEQIARELKIPIEYVPHLFDPGFKQLVLKLLD